MSEDLFLGVKEVFNPNSVLVRIRNKCGVPYSIILERGPNGQFVEMCNTPTNGDGGTMSEGEMVQNYLAVTEATNE